MPAYVLSWNIDIDADTPEEAAKMAYDMIRDMNGGCWEVSESPLMHPVMVDLEEQTTDNIPWNVVEKGGA